MYRKIILLLSMLLMCIACSPAYAVSQNIPAKVEPIIMGDGSITPYFGNLEQDAAPVLVALYDKATESIDVATYELDNPQIIIALDSAYRRGVNVRIITDGSRASDKYQRIALNSLTWSGVPIAIDEHSGEMHMTVSIVDKKFVATGSYCYTLDDSQTSDDIFLVIEEERLAKKCTDAFNQMWNSDRFVRYGYSQ